MYQISLLKLLHFFGPPRQTMIFRISSIYLCTWLFLQRELSFVFKVITKTWFSGKHRIIYICNCHNVSVLPASPSRNTLRWLIVGRKSPRLGTRRCKQHKIQTGSSRELHNTLHLPYILFGDLYCLRVVVLKGSMSPLYNLGGQGSRSI